MSRGPAVEPSAGLSGAWLQMAAGTIALAASVAPPVRGSLPLYFVGAGALFLASWIGARRHAHGWLAPFPMFMVGGLAYLVPTAVTVWFGGVITDDRLPTDSLLIAGAQLSLMAWASACLVHGVAAAMNLTSAPPARREVDVGAGEIKVAAVGLLILGVLSLGGFLFAIGGPRALSEATYGGRYQLFEGWGLLLLGIKSIVTACILAYALAARGTGRSALVIVIAGLALTAGWTLLVGSRSALVQIAVGSMVIYQSVGRRIRMWALALFGAVALALGLVIAVYRSGANIAEMDPRLIVIGANPANSEFGSALTTIGDVRALVPSAEPYRLGSTVPEAIALLVPSWFWPDRPVGAGIWYVERLYPDYADLGGTYAFSPVAEAYLNFGVPGVIAGFALLGLLVAKVGAWTNRRVLPFWTACFYALTLPWIILLPRLDFASFVKSFLLISLGQLVVVRYGARLIRSMTSLIGGRRAAPLPG